jgi:hypothetical protein
MRELCIILLCAVIAVSGCAKSEHGIRLESPITHVQADLGLPDVISDRWGGQARYYAPTSRPAHEWPPDAPRTFYYLDRGLAVTFLRGKAVRAERIDPRLRDQVLRPLVRSPEVSAIHETSTDDPIANRSVRVAAFEHLLTEHVSSEQLERCKGIRVDADPSEVKQLAESLGDGWPPIARIDGSGRRNGELRKDILFLDMNEPEKTERIAIALVALSYETNHLVYCVHLNKWRGGWVVHHAVLDKIVD